MLEIKNRNLIMVLEFLRNDLVAENSMQNIHRMRVVRNLEKYSEQLEEERVEIIKGFADKDENGEVIQTDDGNVTVQDPSGLEKEIEKISEEKYIINDENLETAIKTIANLVKNHEGKLSGDSGEAHYILVEELESYMEGE